MMIKGAPRWDDREAYYTQTNNAVERLLSRYGARASAVSCGPSSAINCLAALGLSVETVSPGGWAPQPEDVLTIWFHDHRNWDRLSEIRAATDPEKTRFSPHEVPQYYPAAVKAVFGARAQFTWNASFAEIAAHVSNGLAVMVNHKPEKNRPGHYVAVVAYDEISDELIFHDSWPEGAPGHNGWARRISRSQWHEMEPYAVVFFEEDA
jgi:hypothetical protein